VQNRTQQVVLTTAGTFPPIAEEGERPLNTYLELIKPMKKTESRAPPRSKDNGTSDARGDPLRLQRPPPTADEDATGGELCVEQLLSIIDIITRHVAIQDIQIASQQSEIAILKQRLAELERKREEPNQARISGEEISDAASNGRTKLGRPPEDAIGEFCYRRLLMDDKRLVIRRRVCEQFQKKWKDDTSVTSCARRYAIRHGEVWPIKRPSLQE
jgi:hypothetical protein